MKRSAYNTGTDITAIGDTMQLNEAVSKRILELLDEASMTQYQLYRKSGVPKSTIGSGELRL